MSTVSNHITRTHHLARLDQSHRVESGAGDARARGDEDGGAGAGADFSARRATTASAEKSAPTTGRRGNVRARGEEDARETRRAHRSRGRARVDWTTRDAVEGRFDFDFDERE